MHWIGWLGAGVAVALVTAGLLLRLVLADPWQEFVPWEDE